MEICIVTVYDSINCGSYWQAYALGNVIQQKLGCNVVYWKRKRDKHSSSSLGSIIKNSLKCFVKGGFSGASRFLQGIREFKKLQKQFITIASPNGIDCFVLGSDTIWNQENAFFHAEYRTYWGIDFLPSKVVSYAASAANTTSVTSEMLDAVSSYSAVSVRDKHTYELVKDADPDVQLVCDPTLLLHKEDYLPHMLPPREKRYIYLYLFEPLNDEIVSGIIKISTENDLIVVNGGSPFSNSYFSEPCVISPNRFISDIYYADYVITDTFHGTVFSTLFNKRFVSINRDKKKILDFLNNVGLEERVADENIYELLRHEIDYTSVNERISVIRETSFDFLAKNLL